MLKICIKLRHNARGLQSGWVVCTDDDVSHFAILMENELPMVSFNVQKWMVGSQCRQSCRLHGTPSNKAGSRFFLFVVFRSQIWQATDIDALLSG